MNKIFCGERQKASL